MALKKTVTTIHGFEATDAYHRIASLNVVNKDKISFTVQSFNVSPEENKHHFHSFGYSCLYNMASQLNPHQQAYLYLKSLPEWADAVDVLEA